MMELRDQLAAIIHDADCGCGGEDIDPAYTTLADNILKTPGVLAETLTGSVDFGGRWLPADDRYKSPAAETRLALLLPKQNPDE